jgi:hypothetical protein
MVVQIFRVKINGDQGALFLPIDRVAKACPGILWADKNDMAEIEEMMEKTHQMGVPVIDIDGPIIIGFHKAKLEAALK